MPTPRNAYEQGQLDARLDLQREGWGIDLDAPFEPEPLHDAIRRQMILLEAHGHGTNLEAHGHGRPDLAQLLRDSIADRGGEPCA